MSCTSQMARQRANAPGPAPKGSASMHAQPNRRRPGVWEREISPHAAEIVLSYETPVTLRQLHFWDEDAYQAILEREAAERRRAMSDEFPWHPTNRPGG